MIGAAIQKPGFSKKPCFFPVRVSSPSGFLPHPLFHLKRIERPVPTKSVMMSPPMLMAEPKVSSPRMVVEAVMVVEAFDRKPVLNNATRPVVDAVLYATELIT